MSPPFANFFPLSWAAEKTKKKKPIASNATTSGHTSSQVQTKAANQGNCFFIWTLLFVLLAVPLTYNGYLSCQLQRQTNEQQIQLELLFGRVHNLTALVDLLAGQTARLDSHHPQLERVKRHSSSIRKHPSKLQLAHVFRWVESNWTDPVAAPVKRRRQVESIPDIGDDKQPEVHFFSTPQPLNRPSDGYEWLSSYSRIPKHVLEEFCDSVQRRCRQPGPPGKPGEKGEKGAEGKMGRTGPPGQGIQGPPGQKGEQGLDGRDGLDGAPGLDGVPGRDGRDGRPGAPGQATNGIPGRNGTDGKPGQKGEKGEPGLVGKTGKPGSPGKRGPPGADGVPGVQVQAWKHGNSSTVLIPPSIDDMSGKELNITVKENETVNLKCVASGQPRPQITWRRDDGRPVLIDGIQYATVNSSDLSISRVSRDNLGQYVCVATNGVPPATKKKVNLFVTFPPLVKIPHSKQIIGASKGSWAQLQCVVDAYPEPFVVEWIFGDSKVLVESAKHYMSEEVLERRLSETYSRLVVLNISRLESADFGLYRCQARNQRGRTYGIITLHESDEKTQLENDTLWRESFVFYGELPKAVEKKMQCECPDCTQSTHSSAQCKQGQRKPIVSMGVSVQLNFTSWHLPKRTSECYLSQIGKPVFYANYDENESIEIGCWMRDPKPVRIEDKEKYWLTRIEHNQLLQEFASKESFRNKLATVNYTLVHRFSGNAQTIYEGHFYYAEEGTNKLIIFNLDTLESAFRNLEPSGGGYLRGSIVRKPSRHVRSHKGRRTASGEHLASKRLYRNHLNKIDIAADENGIWLVYPNLYSEANNTIVMKLNGTQMESMWNLTVDYHEVGDTFIMCGVLYGVESLTEPSTHISFAYDLYANKELKLDSKIEFTNPFLGTQYIGYNPLYQYLSTWDNGNILEYPLKIDNSKSKEGEEEDE